MICNNIHTVVSKISNANYSRYPTNAAFLLLFLLHLDHVLSVTSSEESWQKFIDIPAVYQSINFNKVRIKKTNLKMYPKQIINHIDVVVSSNNVNFKRTT